MNHRIWSALLRTLGRLVAVLLPATGRHRPCRCRGVPRRPSPSPRPRSAARVTTSGLGLLLRVTDPPYLPGLVRDRARPRPSDHAHATDEPDTFHVDGPLVRPYVVAHECQEQHEQREQQEQERRQARRTALALALDGIDVGPWVIHGHPLGSPSPAAAATGAHGVAGAAA